MTNKTHINNSSGREKQINDTFTYHMNNLQFITNKKGEIIDVSDAFCQRVGRPKEELLGVALEDTGLLTEESRKKILYRNIFRLVGKEKPVLILEVKTREGSSIALEIDTKPYIKQGKIVGEIGIVKKIVSLNKTGRAEKEQLAERQTHQLEKTQLIDQLQAELILKQKEVKKQEQTVKARGIALEIKDSVLIHLQGEL